MYLYLSRSLILSLRWFFFVISGVWALDALALLRVFGLGLLLIFSESRVWFP